MLSRSYLEYARGKKPLSLWNLSAPLGWGGRLVARFRSFAFDHGLFQSIEPPLPVISVGNITLGGTNKTPTVEMIARTLIEAGLRVGIVSRGYSGRSDQPVRVLPQERTSRNLVGDEPLLLASRLRRAVVVVSKDRLEGVRLLSTLGVDVVVADDAFQHRRLGRDVDIALVDATCPFGNDRLIPAGILREHPKALARAHLVLMTKSDQIDPIRFEQVKRRVLEYVHEDRLFRASIRVCSWLIKDLANGEEKEAPQPPFPKVPMWAFSAIGSPESFHRLLEAEGIHLVGKSVFQDHHRYVRSDVEHLLKEALAKGAEALVCTEKDLFNLPVGWSCPIPLYVPRITVEIDEPKRFWRLLVDQLRPRIVVASNGYGEDAIGSLLARLLSMKFKAAEVFGFTLVGFGKAYLDRGISVLSPPAETPSGGLLKYSFRAFWRDLRAGLARHVFSQIRTWKRLKGKIRTPVCVGDVYLLLNALLGQGQTPLLVATAKTVYLGGHWRIERWILKRRCLRVWTRDADTAEELTKSGVNAVFEGNPIMDLRLDEREEKDPWEAEGEEEKRPRVLLLPGSRLRAYEDMDLLLRAALLLNERVSCRFLLVPAPTLDRERLARQSSGWEWHPGENPYLFRDGVAVRFHQGSLASAASSSDLLIGLGGTANQVCAGLGVPVVSIVEKGKLVQKKLLQDAELLVPPSPEALASAALRVLTDPELKRTMIEAGIRRLGGDGALKRVVDFVEKELGWQTRCEVYSLLKERVG